MALLDSFAATKDPRVVGQVTAAIYLGASNVYSEAGSVTGHVTRAAFATKISTGGQSFDPLIQSACAFASLTSSSSDTTVNNAVASLWNLWAGV